MANRKKTDTSSTISKAEPIVVNFISRFQEDPFDDMGDKSKMYIKFCKQGSSKTFSVKETKVIKESTINLRLDTPYIIQVDLDGVQTISNCFEAFFFVKPNKVFRVDLKDFSTLRYVNKPIKVKRFDNKEWIEKFKPTLLKLKKLGQQIMRTHPNKEEFADVLFHFGESCFYYRRKQKNLLEHSKQYKEWDEKIAKNHARNIEILKQYL